jgi:hypothetical protein
MTQPGRGTRPAFRPSDREYAALFVVLAVSTLHVTWAILLAFSVPAEHSTPVAAVISVLGGSRTAAIVVLGGTAVLALAASWFHLSSRHKPAHPLLLAAGLIPQQFLMLVSAFGGVKAAFDGHYADGIMRPWQFIISDQLAIILGAFLYTAAMLVLLRADWRRLENWRAQQAREIRPGKEEETA